MPCRLSYVRDARREVETGDGIASVWGFGRLNRVSIKRRVITEILAQNTTFCIKTRGAQIPNTQHRQGSQFQSRRIRFHIYDNLAGFRQDVGKSSFTEQNFVIKSLKHRRFFSLAPGMSGRIRRPAANWPKSRGSRRDFYTLPDGTYVDKSVDETGKTWDSSVISLHLGKLVEAASSVPTGMARLESAAGRW